MKVIVYNINQENKVHLALANRKKHKITIIGNLLTDDNIDFAYKKEVVIIISQDKAVSYHLIEKLKLIGIKLIIFWSLQDLIFYKSAIENSTFEYNTIKIRNSKEAALLIIKTLDYC